MDIELFADATDFLRLHVWSELGGSFRSSGLSIHKHDWSMSSQVICGVIENRVYRTCLTQPPTHRVYYIEYLGEENRLRASEHLVYCELQESQRFHPGMSYTLAPDVFHDIARPGHSMTATLVRGIRHASVRNAVLGPLEAASVYETERIPCDPSTVKDAIDLVFEAYRMSARV
jgi:hypothetical protein